MTNDERRLIVHLWLARWDAHSIASYLGYAACRVAAILGQHGGGLPHETAEQCVRGAAGPARCPALSIAKTAKPPECETTTRKGHTPCKAS
jgi:hypothetical protein